MLLVLRIQHFVVQIISVRHFQKICYHKFIICLIPLYCILYPFRIQSSCVKQPIVQQGPIYIKMPIIYTNTPLAHTSTHCNTLQHTAIHCNTLQHIGALDTHCNTLQHTAKHCNTQTIQPLHRHEAVDIVYMLQHTATHCNTLQHTATHCNTLQHTIAPYSTLQHKMSIQCVYPGEIIYRNLSIQCEYQEPQCVAVCFSVLQCVAVCFGVL